jgi:RNase P/RNase MRP subunit p29
VFGSSGCHSLVIAKRDRDHIGNVINEEKPMLVLRKNVAADSVDKQKISREFRESTRIQKP